MKITWIEPWGREGMLHYSQRLLKGLISSGVEIDLVYPKDVNKIDFPETASSSPMPIIRAISLRSLAALPSLLIGLVQTFFHIRAIRPDVIHINNVYPTSIALLPFLRIMAPTVVTLHDVKPHPGRDDSIRKRIEIYLSVKLSNHLIVHGNSLRKEVIEHYKCCLSKVSVIPHGEYSFFDKTDIRNHKQRDKPTCLCIGRISFYKGIDIFLKAAILIQETRDDIEFVLAGAGNIQEYLPLVRQIHKICLINKYLDDRDFNRLFQEASLIVAPYREASQSGVVAAALGHGRAILASGVGAIPEVITHEENGYLINQLEPEMLARQIIEIFDNRNLLVEVEKNAKRYAETVLSWESIARKTKALYNDLANR